MNEQQINVAIAEAIGWRRGTRKTEVPSLVLDKKIIEVQCWYDPQGNWFNQPPNFHASLDACAVFEETLTPAEWSAYVKELQAVTGRNASARIGQLDWRQINPSMVIDVLLIHATAPQRREAFCHVKGIWREG